jgi:hypothetical protein
MEGKGGATTEVLGLLWVASCGLQAAFCQVCLLSTRVCWIFVFLKATHSCPPFRSQQQAVLSGMGDGVRLGEVRQLTSYCNKLRLREEHDPQTVTHNAGLKLLSHRIPPFLGLEWRTSDNGSQEHGYSSN